MRHFQPRPLESTLDIKSFICLTTIQYTLIAPNTLSHRIQRLYDPQPQLLALLILRDRDVLDVSDEPHVVDELALNNHGASADYCVGTVEHDEHVVGIIAGAHEVVTCVELGFGGFTDGCEDAEGGEEP